MSVLDELDLDVDLRDALRQVLFEHSGQPEAGWQNAYRELRKHNVKPGVYEEVWRSCFETALAEGQSLVPMWFPDSASMNGSNVGKWASELGIPASQFHRWSVANRVEFWKQAVEKLGIAFSSPADRVLDDSGGSEQAAWFPGAKLNIAENCFGADGDAIAIVSQRPRHPLRTMSYDQLRRRANRISNSLVAAGFGVGDGLAVVLPMTELSVAIYLGVVQAGCHIVSIADSFAAPEITTRLEIANAKAVFTYDYQERAGKQIPLFERVAEATQLPIILIPLNEEIAVEAREQDLVWETFLAADENFEPVACAADDIVNVLFSSGTTGAPKAIPWSHLTPIKCAIDGFCHQDIGPGTVCAWPTNLGWMMGPWLIFASLLNRGTIALFEDAPMGVQFGSFICEAKVNMLGVVPTLVKTWRKSGRMVRFDWSSIRVFSSTGESSQRDDMFYLSSLAGMKPVIEYCGGTEIGGGYVTSLVTKPNVPAAFNSPAVGLDFLLLNEEGLEVDEGEVFLEGPAIGLSTRLLNRDHQLTYFEGAPEVPGRAKLRRHGDFFRRLRVPGREEVYFMAGGRVDDTMNLGGIKISSTEIERILNGAPGVRESAAIAVDEREGPSQLVVFIVLQPEVLQTTQDLRLGLNHRIKKFLNPLFKITAVEIVQSLPRTASGKVLRRQLRAQRIESGPSKD